jgi:hypothetical protein
MLFDSFYLTPEQMTRPYEEAREALITSMWLNHFKHLGEYESVAVVAFDTNAPRWVLSFACRVLFYTKMEEDFILNGTGEDECLETMDGTVTALMPAITHSE